MSYAHCVDDFCVGLVGVVIGFCWVLLVGVCDEFCEWPRFAAAGFDGLVDTVVAFCYEEAVVFDAFSYSSFWDVHVSDHVVDGALGFLLDP